MCEKLKIKSCKEADKLKKAKEEVSALNCYCCGLVRRFFCVVFFWYRNPTLPAACVPFELYKQLPQRVCASRGRYKVPFSTCCKP